MEILPLESICVEKLPICFAIYRLWYGSANQSKLCDQPMLLNNTCMKGFGRGLVLWFKISSQIGPNLSNIFCVWYIKPCNMVITYCMTLLTPYNSSFPFHIAISNNFSDNIKTSWGLPQTLQSHKGNNAVFLWTVITESYRVKLLVSLLQIIVAML